MRDSFVLLYKLDSSDPAFLDSFYPLARIRQACVSRGLSFDLVLAREAEADFADFAARASGLRIWLRGNLPETLLVRLDGAGLDCFNAAGAISRTRDKLWLDGFLGRCGAPRPRLLDPADRGALAAALPAIAKPRRGMMGRGVVLVDDAARLDALFSSGGEELVFQEFVAESRGRDYRVFVCRGRVLAAMKRESEGLLSNVHRGARARAVELPPRWTDLALALAEEAGLEYAAVDFLERGPGDLLVCEINTVPGFEALEGASGADIAGSILDLCLGR